MIVELIAAAAFIPAADDLLPDMIVWDKYLLGAYVGTTMNSEPPPGRRALRFDTTTANKGRGPLELRGGRIIDGRREVNQRIYRSDGSWTDRLAGTFVYHDNHSHMHFEDWTQFRLRQYLPGGGVGSVVRTGTKTSFCIIETTVYDNTLEGYNGPWGPYDCGLLQGQRPGRADTYTSGLSGQYIDIEGVPDGTYWLEGEVDPNNNVVELDETNNITRVLMNIGNVPPPTPDRYEHNDNKTQVDLRMEGAPNSPNFGLVNSFKTVADLSMDDNEDWFKFKLHGTGTAGDYVRIESPYHSGQNLKFYLLDGNGNTLSANTTNVSIKQLPLEGRGPGTFYLKVVRHTGANPNYLLTIEPDGNLPPEIVVTSPEVGNILVERGWNLVPVSWFSNDVEGDPKTVSLFIDRNPVVGDTNLALGGYQDLNGSDLEANLNTAGMDLGSWYVIGRAWDGGAYGYSISPGTFTVYVKGDINFDGLITLWDYWRVFKAYKLTGKLPPDWAIICDMDRDGDFDDDDLAHMQDDMG